MGNVRPKKHLGQHFLTDESVAENIANALTAKGCDTVIEVGPGMGVLTKYLIKKPFNFYVSEIDKESTTYLNIHFPEIKNKIIEGDFLKIDIKEHFAGQLAIIGNFPYNISSQILFKVYENKELVPELVGMFQKEVAQRVASKEGSKVYGILSVLLQAFYDIEYLFTVNENVFNPPPKVKSGVIRMTRKPSLVLGCDEVKFKQVVKMAFNQRRKTLRNSVKQLIKNEEVKSNPILNLRPEQLSVSQFVDLVNLLE